MKFDSSLFLKWIDLNCPLPGDGRFQLINQCVLAGIKNNDLCAGLTVFQPRDLNNSICERLQRRRENPNFKDLKFILFAPHFLKHRVDTLKNDLANVEIVYTSFVSLKKKPAGYTLSSKIRVVNVDDSPVLLKFLKHSFQELEFFDVVAQVSDPHKAVETILQHQPDFITMDIQMPGKTGVEVVRDLLSNHNYPVIMISSLSLEEGSQVIEALNEGAFDYIQKPKLEDKKAFLEELKEKALCAIEGRGAHSALKKPVGPVKKVASHLKVNFPSDLVWCLGSSTGGTQALTRIFTSLPDQIPPTLIVQHMPPVFSRSFAMALNDLVPFTVKEAENGDILQPNHVYIAPGGLQMGVENSGGKLKIVLSDSDPVNRFKPSVDYMFKQIAQIKSLRLIAGLLTGMGKDGAEGMLVLKKKGAHTFVQDEQTSAVYGMPRAAVELGATNQILPLDTIAQHLLSQSLEVKKIA